MKEGWIRISDVEKYYGRKGNLTKAIDRVSFEVEQGEFMAIMGPSGSGKTTLLNLISTIDSTSAGHIWFKNQDITVMKNKDLAEFRKKNLGFVFQNYNLLDTLTIEENILIALIMNEAKKKEAIERAVSLEKMLGIYDVRNKYPYEVSGGQKQRCACARAIANNPSLILADEPTGALDSHSSQMLMETLTQMNDELNATILMVTHDAFSASYTKRVLFLKDGKIFHQLYRGNKDRRVFLNEIYNVLSMPEVGDKNAR